MQTELISLSKAFTENLFRIPDYQRGYAWGPRQLKEFWSDIDQLEDGKNHYTGVLTLEDVPRRVYERWDDDLWIIQSKSFRPYFVVDGQQRLTTSIILIMAILDKVGEYATLNYDSVDDIKKRFIFLSKDGGLTRSYVFGYEKDNPSYEFLKVKVFGEQSEKHSLVEPTIYTKNLESAKSFFVEKIKDCVIADLERIYTKVTQNLLFNVFTISDGIDVHVTFETMNNRGKALSQLELLKNRLIYLSTKLPVSAADSHDRAALRKTINESWKTAYHYLGRATDRALKDDFFLQVQSRCYFSDKLSDEEMRREGIIARKGPGRERPSYLLDKVFTARRLQPDAEDQLTAEDLRRYALDVKRSVELFYKINCPKDAGVAGEEKVWLERIRRLDSQESAVLLLSVYRGRNSALNRVSLLNVLERFIFFKNIAGYFFYQREFQLAPLATDLAAGRKSIREVTDRLEIIVNEFVVSSEFTSGLRQLGKVRDYYRWSPTRYVLFEYEQHLQSGTRTNRSKLSWEEFSKEDWENDYVTLEHVYPQRAAHPDWKASFASLSTQQRNRLKHTIGNLTPLSIGRNSSLSNRPFQVKKGDASSQSGFCYGCYSEIEISHEETWGPTQILLRGVKILSFMEERWGFRLGTMKDKRSFLGLDFVEFPKRITTASRADRVRATTKKK